MVFFVWVEQTTKASTSNVVGRATMEEKREILYNKPLFFWGATSHRSKHNNTPHVASIASLANLKTLFIITKRHEMLETSNQAGYSTTRKIRSHFCPLRTQSKKPGSLCKKKRTKEGLFHVKTSWAEAESGIIKTIDFTRRIAVPPQFDIGI